MGSLPTLTVATALWAVHPLRQSERRTATWLQASLINSRRTMRQGSGETPDT